MAFVLGIITARGGSKGIPGKNVIDCAGKPLIAWTIEAALGCNSLDDLILSTDSPLIAETAHRYGLSTPDLRPAHLSDDTAKSLDVIRYEIEKYEELYQKAVDVIVILQPTAPLRRPADIDLALKFFFKEKVESLVSVCDAGHVHPSTMYTTEKDLLKPIFEKHIGTRRQDMKSVYIRNGAIYISSRNQIIEHNSILSGSPAYYEMPRERSVNIDDLFDLKMADWLLRETLNENTQP